MGMPLREAVALVTGASSGIGAASAVRLARAGARVIVHGRDGRRLARLAERAGAIPVYADLGEPGAARRLAETAAGIHGRLDILVNNAGVGWAGDFSGMPPAEVARLVAVNLTAPIALTRAVLPGMLARNRGHLMFVTSIAGRTGVAGEAVYAATKSGLDTFAESLRLELHGTGVRVGVLVPGVVQTAFFANRGRPYRRTRPRPLRAEQVAEALVACIASGRPERYAPGWLRLAVAVRGTAPGLYRSLAGRYGGQ